VIAVIHQQVLLNSWSTWSMQYLNSLASFSVIIFFFFQPMVLQWYDNVFDTAISFEKVFHVHTNKIYRSADKLQKFGEDVVRCDGSCLRQSWRLLCAQVRSATSVTVCYIETSNIVAQGGGVTIFGGPFLW